MDKIFIEQLAVDAIIGVYEEERLHKQPLLLDVTLYLDTKQAAASDDLSYALDYHQLTISLKQFIETSTFQLIEALAEAVAQQVLAHKMVKQVDLTLRKPQALAGLAQTVGIQITRHNVS